MAEVTVSGRSVTIESEDTAASRALGVDMSTSASESWGIGAAFGAGGANISVSYDKNNNAIVNVSGFAILGLFNRRIGDLRIPLAGR